MLATELLSNIIIPLSPEHSGAEALAEMKKQKVSHLPVVELSSYLGLLAEQDVQDAADQKISLRSYKKLPVVFVTEDQPLFEVLDVLHRNSFSALPVLDKEEAYLGSVTPQSMMPAISSLLAARLPGSLITLEVKSADYMASEMARIVESNDARIMSLFTRSVDPLTLEVTLRIDQIDISDVVRAFERYNYTVRDYHMGENKLDDLYADRFDLLMRYMNT